MLTITATQLRAVLLARGDDPRPFTKALWVTERFVMCTHGHRMHLLWHGQHWPHGNVAVPLRIAADTNTTTVDIDRSVFNGMPFLPVMGATLPPLDRYVPDLPTMATLGPLRCAINGKYLSDAQDAIKAMREEGQDDCLHMTSAGVWAWCNGKFLVCVAPLLNEGHQVQLKGFTEWS